MVAVLRVKESLEFCLQLSELGDPSARFCMDLRLGVYFIAK